MKQPLSPEQQADLEALPDKLTALKQAMADKAQTMGLAKPPRLVAVSKKKASAFITKAYDMGHRHFGENYVNELVQKAPELPEDIEWHFIGHLQSNKATKVARIANITVETVDSLKLATKLNASVELLTKEGQRDEDYKLRVFIQVNTSGEETKSGIIPNELVDLVKKVVVECPRLDVVGLMTIGKYGGDGTEDFKLLVSLRAEACRELGRSEDSMELSMGMSGEWENAMELGSTNIRVGSSIFGSR